MPAATAHLVEAVVLSKIPTLEQLVAEAEAEFPALAPELENTVVDKAVTDLIQHLQPLVVVVELAELAATEHITD